MLIYLSSHMVWRKYMSPGRRLILLDYLNVVSIIVVTFPLYKIASFWIKAADDTPRPWSSYIDRANPATRLPVEDPPDIYYIILDGYGRADVLQSLYTYDNSQFLDALEKRGFFIGEQSQSNYLRTSLSITSALNMEYINFTADLAGADSVNRIPMFDLANNNLARQLLEEVGYTFILVDSGSAFTRFYDADVFLTPFKTRPTLFEMWFYSTTSVNTLYEPELPFTQDLLQVFPVAGYASHREFILDALEQLAVLPEMPGPKFVFAHVIAPHPPFVLDAHGNPLHPNYPYVTGDGASFVSGVETYKQGYIGQVEYLNRRALEVVDAILEKSAQPPVIIIQGDHGPGLLLILEGDDMDTCLWERASILNVYYFPEGKTELLYPSISPINSFRTVFNTYLGTDFELHEDQTWLSLFDVPYNFTEITDQVRNSCVAP
ncbi:MAG: LTA synthase family protein [Chloroflexi bacterium]|nr:LTA synthase family protein [Chloroflexota bacterium]